MIHKLDDRCVAGVVQQVGGVLQFTDNIASVFLHILNQFFCRTLAQIIGDIDSRQDGLFGGEHHIVFFEPEGAHQVIDHRRPLAAQLQAVGLSQVDYVAGLTHTAEHLAAIAEIIAPQGRFGLIDDPPELDILPFKRKSVSVHWEFMFTRSLFDTPDVLEQHRLLTRVAEMVDRGELKPTIASDFGLINAANLLRAHALLESGKSMGKVVLTGFE